MTTGHWHRPGRSVLLATAAICLWAAPAAAGMARDVDCNASVDTADLAALENRLFNPTAPTCPNADVNRDRRLSAADLIAFASGPRISFLGVASADGRPGSPLGTADGATLYYSGAGSGFLLVVEVAAPPHGASIGTTLLNSSPRSPEDRPDLQVIVDHPLGDGTRTVCDEFGVPAVSPPSFDLTESVSNAMNDLACRFVVATTRSAACTQDYLGRPGFISPSTRVQFCLTVNRLLAFPRGDTGLIVQVRDRSGLVGPTERMIVRVGQGPPPPTFTPVPPTATRTVTATASSTPTASDTPTPSATRTATATRTRTPTATPTRTATATRVATATSTGTARPTGTVTRSAAATASPTATAPTGAATPTRTATAAAATATGTTTRTSSSIPTLTRTPTATRTATATAKPPATPTATRTPTPSASPTPTGETRGPVITFLGLARADDALIEPREPGDTPVYEVLFGYGFRIVVEAKPGASRARVGSSTYDGYGGAPDLLIQVNRPLGDGSIDVCDDTPPLVGGVPAVDPPNFDTEDPSVAASINDLSCRFIDGTGQRLGRPCSEVTACVRRSNGQFACVESSTTMQYCALIGRILAFPAGETVVTVRVRDVQRNLGPPKQMIVRVP